MISRIQSYILPALISLLCIATGISFPFLRDRIHLEKSVNTVEISVDAADVLELSAHGGVSFLTLLGKMRSAGVSSIVISEMTLSDVIVQGLVGIERIPDSLILKTENEQIYRSLMDMLSERYGIRVIGKGKQEGRYTAVIPITVDFPLSGWNNQSPLGYDPALLSAARDAKLDVILRPANVRGSSWLSREQADGYVFDAEEVPGFPGNEDHFGRIIAAREQRGIVFEFSRTRGKERLTESVRRFLITGHTIMPRELEKNAVENTLLNRWQRAVTERSIRYLLVRTLPGKGIEENAGYIRQLVKRIEKRGFRSGRAEPPHYPESSFLSLRIAIIALVALLVPLLAMSSGSSARTPLAGYVIVNVIALAGGCVLSACFYDLRFMERLVIMPGIKLYLVLPVAMAALFLYRDKKPGEIAKRPITVGHAALAAGIVIAVYILIARSGNDSSAWLHPDTRVREWLETVLSVRPRTKEFLIAQPLLFAGLATRRKLLLIAGSLAPVSVLNTFFHAHTPFLLSLERSLIGMVVGLVFGYIFLKASKIAKCKV